MWPPGTCRNWCLGSERLSYFTSLFTQWILAIWGRWNGVHYEIKPPHDKDGNSNLLKSAWAVPLWCGTAAQRWQNGDANVPFVCVLISIVTATLNPLIYSRKQWKRNCSHDWLSRDAARADKNWTHDQVAGLACMPLEHIIPSAIWFKDTILEPYKENTIRNKSLFYVHGADPEHHPILWDTSVPLVTWQKGSLCNKIRSSSPHQQWSNISSSARHLAKSFHLWSLDEHPYLQWEIFTWGRVVPHWV